MGPATDRPSAADEPGPSNVEDDLPRMTLAEHLDELRRRLLIAVLALVVCMVLAFIWWSPLWAIFRHPFTSAAALEGIDDPRLWSLDPGEGFLTTLKVCFLAGLVVASPIVLWQLWGFVAAGLYAHERRLVRIYFPVSLLLFVLGVLLAYFVLIPFGMRFLIRWNLDMGLGSEFRIQTYVSTCLTMIFGMAFLFELPLVMLFLQATDLVRRQTFLKGWRVAVLLAFVVGMFLTDPSPVTQVLMATPVVGLYFLGIWGGRYVGPERRRFRWWHLWPLVLIALAIVALWIWRVEIGTWAESLFGAEPTAPPAPADGPQGGP